MHFGAVYIGAASSNEYHKVNQTGFELQPAPECAHCTTTPFYRDPFALYATDKTSIQCKRVKIDWVNCDLFAATAAATTCCTE